MAYCPCGHETPYVLCCGRYLEQSQYPLTAEQLMRSRYTAYVLGKLDYLWMTAAGQAKQEFNLSQVSQWNQVVTWLGLTVIHASNPSPTTATVEFIARYYHQRKIHFIHEMSEFSLQQQRWFYVGGRWIPKSPQVLAKNAPCWCGSGKKFKNCHDKI